MKDTENKTRQVSLTLPKPLVAKIDKERGLATRSKFITYKLLTLNEFKS